MSRSSLSCTALTIGLSLLAIAGCGVDSDSLDVGLVRDVSLPSDEDVAESAHPELDAKASSQAWSAPYPQRKNAFAYPGNGTDEVEATTTDTSQTSNVSVVGFASVDRPVVILRFRDQTRTLGVGDIHGSIQVTDIAAPRVTLRMGNLEWTISMFDKSISK
jgi:hypothetical protein